MRDQRATASVTCRRADRSTVARLAASLLVAMAACGGGTPSSEAPAATRAALVAVGEGAVLDPSTGLEWTSRDNDEPLDWDAADRHCHDLTLDGGADWRLPEIAELRALFDKRFDQPCGTRHCHLDPAIRLAGPYVWSGTAPGTASRYYFDFAFASSLSPRISPELVRRVLCVRRRAA